MRPPTLLVQVLLSLAAAAPAVCPAESSFQSGAPSPLIAMSHVDFQITIPKFIFLRIGSGTGTAAGGWASNANVDLISWVPAAGTIGNGVALAGTGGDLTGGVETAVIVANHGNVTLSSTTLGKLADGAGDTISYAQIRTVARKLTTVQVLGVPALADAATRTITVAAAGKIVQRDAKWTYTYRNQTVPPAGTYGGVNTNNARVTYTASVP
ncbi:MAG TPA: hypothetical protein VMT66_16000 [Steroidobacteraceae bacterium]|nr:hypothetical protein [Steroidobacteraceae bacterium]